MTQSIGLGGGGSLFNPVICPGSPGRRFVACDMGGLYYSGDGGSNWTMIDTRDMRGSTLCPVAFAPDSTDTVLAFGQYRGLRRGHLQTNGSWQWDAPLVNDTANGDLNMTAFALDPTTGALLLYGTTGGAFLASGTQCTDSAGNPIADEVVGFFVDPNSLEGLRSCYVATRRDVLHTPSGGGAGSWQSLGTLPATTPDTPSKVHINHFAAAADSNGTVVLYVTLATKIPAAGDTSIEGGVYSYLSEPGATSASWQRAWGANSTNPFKLDTTVPAPADQDASSAYYLAPSYHWLGVRPGDTFTVYVTVCGSHTLPDTGSDRSKDRNSGVYRSTDRGESWVQCYYGERAGHVVNVRGGWIDYELGWSFGGAAQIEGGGPSTQFGGPLVPITQGGFALGPTSMLDPDCAVYANNAAIYSSGIFLGRPSQDTPEDDVSCGCANPSWLPAGCLPGIAKLLARGWAETYTKRASGQGSDGNAAVGDRWQTTGLDVTSTWHHRRAPGGERYICSTDIGLARSDDDGASWKFVPIPSPWTGVPSNTVYDLHFPEVSGLGHDRFAALSDQHDIPWNETALGKPDPSKTIVAGGGVAGSSAPGTNWTDISGGLPTVGITRGSQVVQVVPPVLALTSGEAMGFSALLGGRALYAGLWEKGVYAFDGSNWTAANGSSGSQVGDGTNLHPLRLEHVDDGTSGGRLLCSVTASWDGATSSWRKSGVYRSDDSGGTWTCITESNAFASVPGWKSGWELHRAMDFAVHPLDPDTMLLCTAGLSGVDPAGAVYRTTNGGSSWSLVLDASSPALPAHWPWFDAFSAAFHPGDPDHVAFVTSGTHGLLATTDAGANWAELTGVPFLDCTRVDVEWDPNRRQTTLFVTTFGGGAWRVDLDSTWPQPGWTWPY